MTLRKPIRFQGLYKCIAAAMQRITKKLLHIHHHILTTSGALHHGCRLREAQRRDPMWTSAPIFYTQFTLPKYRL
jgi:hypothetical protein